jgi:hypothetical protein
VVGFIILVKLYVELTAFPADATLFSTILFEVESGTLILNPVFPVWLARDMLVRSSPTGGIHAMLDNGLFVQYSKDSDPITTVEGTVKVKLCCADEPTIEVDSLTDLSFNSAAPA